MSNLNDLVEYQPSQLHYKLYGNSIHPEWFQFSAYRRIGFAGQTVTAGVLPVGHLFIWHRGQQVLTECLSHPESMPERACLASHRVTHGRRIKLTLAQGLRCETTLQVEVLSLEVYRQVHQELQDDGYHRGLLVHAPNQMRRGLVPFTFLTAETVIGGMVLSSFHTFPDHQTLIKSQTLFDFTDAEPPLVEPSNQILDDLE